LNLHGFKMTKIRRKMTIKVSGLCIITIKYESTRSKRQLKLKQRKRSLKD
jgi:hypothetical protein